MSRDVQVTFDAQDPRALSFWRDVLGYVHPGRSGWRHRRLSASDWSPSEQRGSAAMSPILAEDSQAYLPRNCGPDPPVVRGGVRQPAPRQHLLRLVLLLRPRAALQLP
jgi:hypothetical protein